MSKNEKIKGISNSIREDRMVAEVYAMGTSAGAAAQGTGSMLASLVPLILMVVIFYFLLIRPQQKKAKQHQDMLNTLKKGDNIVTNAGFYGVIEEVHPEYFVISYGGVSIKTIRSAVSMVITEEMKQ